MVGEPNLFHIPLGILALLGTACLAVGILLLIEVAINRAAPPGDRPRRAVGGKGRSD